MSKVTFVNEAEINEAIAQVRHEDPEVDWMLTGYVPNTSDQIQLVGKGVGSADALQAHLTVDGVYNGLVRCEDFVDGHRTIKFCFIKFLGERVKPMLKARVSTHSGSIQEKFQPYHVDMFCTDASEVTTEAVVKLVTSTSMSKSNVVQTRSSAAPATSPSSASSQSPAARTAPTQTYSTASYTRTERSSSQKAPSSPSAASAAPSTLVIENEDEIKQQIAALRAGEANWVLTGYVDKTKIGFVGSGIGGCEEMKSFLQPDTINYGIIRTIDKIDESETVKFVFFHWLGPRVSPMQKARVSTHKGGAEALFRPFHVEIFASSLDEISDDIVKELVGKTSFSRSSVIEKKA